MIYAKGNKRVLIENNAYNVIGLFSTDHGSKQWIITGYNPATEVIIKVKLHGYFSCFIT